MTYRLDVSPQSVVVVCSCGYRGLGVDRVEVLVALRAHHRAAPHDRSDVTRLRGDLYRAGGRP